MVKRMDLDFIFFRLGTIITVECGAVINWANAYNQYTTATLA